MCAVAFGISARRPAINFGSRPWILHHLHLHLHKRLHHHAPRGRHDTFKMPYTEDLDLYVRQVLRQANSNISTKPTSITPAMMACILVKKKGLRLDTIVLQACRYFPAVAATAAQESTRPGEMKEILRRTCVHVVRSYDLGFETHRLPALFRSPVKFSISEESARTIFRGVSSRPSGGHDRLAALPPEIQLTIFEEVLVLPDSGVMVISSLDRCGSDIRSPFRWDEPFPRTLHVLTRNPGEKKPLFEWDDADPRLPTFLDRPDEVDTYIISLPSLLDVLLVNKATRDTCAAIFYGKNTFHGNSPTDIINLLKSLSLDRVGLLRKISFIYRPPGRVSANELMKLLTTTNITSIKIGVCKADWQVGYGAPRKKVSDEPTPSHLRSTACLGRHNEHQQWPMQKGSLGVLLAILPR